MLDVMREKSHSRESLGDFVVMNTGTDFVGVGIEGINIE
jgi:hypothetical protein